MIGTNYELLQVTTNEYCRYREISTDYSKVFIRRLCYTLIQMNLFKFKDKFVVKRSGMRDFKKRKGPLRLEAFD